MPAFQDVVTRPAVQNVVAVAADERVILRPTDQLIPAVATVQGVVVGPAVQVVVRPRCGVGRDAALRVAGRLCPLQEVVAAFPVQVIAAVPPDERVVADAAPELVGPGPTVQVVVRPRGDIGRDPAFGGVELLGALKDVVAAFAPQCVAAVAAHQGVAAVAAPNLVGPGLAVEFVVRPVGFDRIPILRAFQDIVPVAAVNDVVAVAPDQRVVVGPAID